jgi:hypothetical protein
MERFVTRHRDRIVGIVTGFDRMLFRGTLRSISYVDGLDKFLSSQRVLYKDFAAYVARLSDDVKTAAMTMASQANRPFEYVASAQIRKEDHARAIAERDGVTEGWSVCSRAWNRVTPSPSAGIGKRSGCVWWRANANACICISTFSTRTSA